MPCKKSGRKRHVGKDLDVFYQSWGGLEEVFDTDAKARGQYIPAPAMQSLDKDGTIIETYSFNDDGTLTLTKDCVLGMPNGAPQEFLNAEAETIKGIDEKNKNTEFQCALAQQISTGDIPNAQERTGSPDVGMLLFESIIEMFGNLTISFNLSAKGKRQRARQEGEWHGFWQSFH